MKVFISYSNYEEAFVEKLQKNLSELNIDFFEASQINPGEDWFVRIKEEIEKAEIILVILSNASVNNQWVSSELSFALADKYQNKSKKIIPILTEKLKERPFFISDIQYLDFTNKKDFETNIEQLKKALIHYHKENSGKEARKVSARVVISGTGGMKISNSEINSAKIEFLSASRNQLKNEIYDYMKRQRATITSISIGLITSIIVSLIISSVAALSYLDIFLDNYDYILTFIFGALVTLFAPFIYSKIAKKIKDQPE